jgi:hypothetical protein
MAGKQCGLCSDMLELYNQFASYEFKKHYVLGIQQAMVSDMGERHVEWCLFPDIRLHN